MINCSAAFFSNRIAFKIYKYNSTAIHLHRLLCSPFSLKYVVIAPCAQILPLISHLDPNSLARSADSSDPPPSPRAASGSAAGAAAAKNAGASSYGAGSGAAAAPPRRPSSPPKPPPPDPPNKLPIAELPPAAPRSEDKSSASGSGAGAGAAGIYCCAASNALSWLRSGAAGAGGGGGGGGGGARDGIAPSGPDKSTTFDRVLIAFSNMGST